VRLRRCGRRRAISVDLVDLYILERRRANAIAVDIGFDALSMIVMRNLSCGTCAAFAARVT